MKQNSSHSTLNFISYLYGIRPIWHTNSDQTIKILEDITCVIFIIYLDITCKKIFGNFTINEDNQETPLQNWNCKTIYLNNRKNGYAISNNNKKNNNSFSNKHLIPSLLALKTIIALFVFFMGQFSVGEKQTNLKIR